MSKEGSKTPPQPDDERARASRSQPTAPLERPIRRGDDAGIASPVAPPTPMGDATVPREGVSQMPSGGPLQRGELVGRYVVLGQVGAGGMGVVYSAYDPELDRRLAIKLLHASALADRDKEQARLLREAQALARLRHSSVVAIHDVGTIGERVFLAMELLEGRTLAEWLRERPRDWREILAVLTEAGQGLVAAHAAGVIHRDFKPGNVMVDSREHACVVDFGLARTDAAAPLETPGAAESLPSSAGSPAGAMTSWIGTPHYMSPEQLARRPADAKSDQFSFCVALYEALYGERPFEGEALAVLLESTSKGRVRAAPRGRRVPGWLRALILRGLRADPDERYPSMQALLDALESRRTRARRWALLGASGAALAAIGLAVWQTGKHRVDPCGAGPERFASAWSPLRATALEAAFAKTGAVFAPDVTRDVEQTLGRYRDQWTAMHREACEATSARGEQSQELLDLRMHCLSRRLQDLGALVDELGHADARVVEKAPAAVRGLAPVADCADVASLRAATPPPTDPEKKARLAKLEERLAQEKALEAAAHYKEELESVKPLVEEAHALGYAPFLSEAQMQLAIAQRSLGDLKSSQASWDDALVSAESGRDERAEARAWFGLVTVAYKQAHPDEGHLWARHARALDERLGSEALLANTLQTEGMLYALDSKYEQAEPQLAQAEAIKEKLFGRDDVAVADANNDWGIALSHQGKYADAIARYERARAIREKTTGKEHPEYARVLNNLGGVYAMLGDVDRALAFRQEAMALREKQLGPEHPDLILSLYSVADVLTNARRFGEAEALERRGLAIAAKKPGLNPNTVVKLHDGLGVALVEEGRPAEALPELQQALAIIEGSIGKSHPFAADVRGHIGMAELELHQTSAGIAELKNALAILDLGSEGKSAMGGEAHLRLGDALEKTKRLDEAGEQYRDALALLEKSGADPVLLASALTGRGEVELANGNLKAHANGAAPWTATTDPAIDDLQRALGLLEQHPHAVPETARARFALARALAKVPAQRERSAQLAAAASEGYAAAGPRYQGERAEVEAFRSARR